MKLLKLVLSSIIVSCLASCGGGGGGSSTTSTPTVPSSIPSGAKISINPEIELTSELSVGSPATAIYSNSDGTNFSVNSGENILLTMETSGSTITVSFELATKEKIEVITSDFTDLGEDGYYDEFTGEIKVNGKKNMTIRGYFTGTKKPRNLAVSNPVDINRAPTEEEFKKYFTGIPFYHIETSPEPGDDEGLFMFNTDGTITDLNPDPDENEEPIETWKYFYNSGTPYIEVLDKHGYEGNPNHYHIYKVQLNFTTFYEGTYEGLTEEEDGVITEDDDKGIWKLYSNIPDGFPSK
jgi:hypothetical protein